MKILSRFKNKYKIYFIFKKSLEKLESIGKIKKSSYREYQLRGAELSDLYRIKSIFLSLNRAEFAKSNEKILKRHPGKTIIVAESVVDGKREIVGMDLFYLNARDLSENTVHEGFVGVLPEFEGKGIATAMRKNAIAHFRCSGFSGISTRISKNNIASLRSAEQLGFKPVEEYFDLAMQEERYYLVCNFESNCDQ